MKKLLFYFSCLSPISVFAQSKMGEAGYTTGKIIGLLLPIAVVVLVVYLITKPKNKNKQNGTNA